MTEQNIRQQYVQEGGIPVTPPPRKKQRVEGKTNSNNNGVVYGRGGFFIFMEKFLSACQEVVLQWQL